MSIEKSQGLLHHQHHQLHPKSMGLICPGEADQLQGVRIFSRRVRFLNKGNVIKRADGSPNSPMEGCKIQEVELGWHKMTFWILYSQHLSLSLKWGNGIIFLCSYMESDKEFWLSFILRGTHMPCMSPAGEASYQ